LHWFGKNIKKNLFYVKLISLHKARKNSSYFEIKTKQIFFYKFCLHKVFCFKHMIPLNVYTLKQRMREISLGNIIMTVITNYTYVQTCSFYRITAPIKEYPFILSQRQNEIKIQILLTHYVFGSLNEINVFTSETKIWYHLKVWKTSFSVSAWLVGHMCNICSGKL